MPSLSPPVETPKSILLPNELWQQIFYFATSPHCERTTENQTSSLSILVGELSLLLSDNIRSATLKTKCNLSLVSRSFRSLSEHLLYEGIICRDTLKMIQVLDGVGRPGRYVRHITLKAKISYEMMNITHDST